jgi:hypothetical protein
MISSRPVVSERRAATARANGAKSRGPITAQGKANSSRNSLRHGLRAKLQFDDPESRGKRVAILAAYMNDLQPRSSDERTLVEIMAFFQWRRISLWNLETDLVDRAICQTRSSENPATQFAGLELLNRIAGRFERQFTRALAEFERLRASGSRYAKLDIAKRSHQIIENKATEPGESHVQAQSNPAEPDPQRSTSPGRQTVVDLLSASSTAKCISPLQAAAAAQTP